MKIEIEELRAWFEENRRALPWRAKESSQIDPYAVWVSEVMLQQTQVAVVIAYFHRWMALFPTIEKLANASQEEVIKAWEGLGYYSRARSLHAAAKTLVEHYGGKLPDSYEELIKIKGLGPYTAGAILSFAFHQKRAAVDGNVLRVMARLLGIEEVICKSSTKKSIEKATFDHLPTKEPWVVMEGLIELGALVCKKVPICLSCPLRSSCSAYRLGKTAVLPRMKPKAKTTHLHRNVVVIFSGSSLLLRKAPEGEVMQGLYEFPFFERGALSVLEQIKKTFDINPIFVTELKELSHGFTRFKATLYPTIWQLDHKPFLAPDLHWVEEKKIADLPFSSGHRKLIELVKKQLL